MAAILIQNALIVTLDDAQPILPNGQILIEGERITAVGASVTAPKDAQVLDVNGMVVMPGLINAHHHLYSSFARGFSAPGAPAANFIEILDRLWWKLDLALDPEGVRYSSLVALIEAIRTGCTTIVDHHASPACTDGSLDILEDTFREAGLSGCLCYETSDRNVKGDGVAENARFIRKTRKGDGQVTALFGLHAQMTLSDETLAETAAICQDTGAGVHVHVAEDLADEEDSLAKHGARIIQRLNAFGLTGPNSLFIHGIHLDETEMDLIAETGTMMVHNPESNMNNAVGTQKMLTLLQKGILLGLGTDGMTSHMISSARVAHLLQRATLGDPRVAFVEACEMLLENNAKIAARCFPEIRGQLAVGQLADLAVFDYRPTTPLEPGRFLGHLLYGLNYARVHTTIARGRILMRDSTLLSLDEQEICAKARECARATWGRIQ
ncbi:MAG: putative aminohydrolase SsnA [Verrucomicrobiota bacterium]|jgi:putative selenium metabolism protein SsnA|nr:putative aminohydrolase SsnA [Verrucomicrobiota bacterium]